MLGWRTKSLNVHWKGVEDPNSVMAFLDRSSTISRGGTHLHWPAYSPYLSCLDFSFWTQALNRVVESEPETIKELKKVVGMSPKRMYFVSDREELH